MKFGDVCPFERVEIICWAEDVLQYKCKKENTFITVSQFLKTQKNYKVVEITQRAHSNIKVMEDDFIWVIAPYIPTLLSHLFDISQNIHR